jgi:hypothetical protein
MHDENGDLDDGRFLMAVHSTELFIVLLLVMFLFFSLIEII